MTICSKSLATLVILLSLAWAALPQTAEAQSQAAPGYQVIASVFPPYSFESANRAEGLTVDGVRALFREVGLTPDIEVYPWARAFKTAREKPGTLLFSVARTPEREAMFTWIGPVMDFDVWLYRKAERTDIAVEILSDLRHYSFAGLIDDVKTTFLENRGAHVTEVRSEDLAIKMLAAGRIDMIASDKSAMRFRLATLGFEARDYVPVIRLAALSRPLYLVAHPKTDPHLVDRLRAALARRLRNGN